MGGAWVLAPAPARLPRCSVSVGPVCPEAPSRARQGMRRVRHGQSQALGSRARLTFLTAEGNCSLQGILF